MSNFLVNYAIKNIWCNPNQDFELIFAPKKISKQNGVIGFCFVIWNYIPLPDSSNYYHVYQLGKIPPTMLGFFQEKNKWKTLSSLINENYLFADIYVNSGIQLPKFETYIVVTDDNNIVLSIKNQKGFVDLNVETLYIRFYSNAYFYSARSQSTPNFIYSFGQRMNTVQEGLNFQYIYQSYLNKNGLTNLYVNGVLVNNFIPQYTPINSILEFVYDSSVKKVVEFDIQNLLSFTSILDQKTKYLLHYTDDQSTTQTIDYRDDIDIYLVQKAIVNNNETFNGVYYHKNLNDAFRQLTHRDYSICIEYLNNYLTSIDSWTSLNDLTIRLHIRNSGYNRSLSNENSRIKELYKLPENEIQNSMVGIDSNVDVWKVENLENSNYVKIMDKESSSGITQSLVEQALGYNAVSSLLANTPLEVELVNDRRVVRLPELLQNYSTFYEYDSNGLLIDYYFHTSGCEYTPVNSNTTLIDGIVGKGTNVSPIVFNQQNTPIDETLDYRFYVCTMEHGSPYNDWKDVTNNTNYYTINNGKVNWLIDQTQYATAVKSDKDFLAYKLSLTVNDGLIKFSINSFINDGVNNGNSILYLPVGKLDIWMNNYYLVRDIDYFITWPQIIICSKKYLNSNKIQNIIIRGNGFCNSDMTLIPTDDYGFVKYEMLSRNNVFNIRDDKVLHCNVGGLFFEKNKLVFSEDHPSIGIDSSFNGLPYSIDSVIVPMRSETIEDTYDYLNSSLNIDQEISNYLSKKIQDPVESNPDSITDKYVLYSPFTCKIMYDLLNNVIDLTKFKGQYSDQDVKNYLTSLGYTYILDYDPALKNLDLNYVKIQPHDLNTVVTLNIYQYNFLSRAIHVFLFDKVEMTPAIAILSTGI